MQSVIVYSNPLQQMFWEFVMSPVCGAVVCAFLAGLLLYIAYLEIRKSIWLSNGRSIVDRKRIDRMRVYALWKIVVALLLIVLFVMLARVALQV